MPQRWRVRSSEREPRRLSVHREKLSENSQAFRETQEDIGLEILQPHLRAKTQGENRRRMDQT